MTQTKGAYRLGKSIVESLEALNGQLELDGRTIAATPENRTKVRTALLEGTRDAGFISLFFFLAMMLPAESEPS